MILPPVHGIISVLGNWAFGNVLKEILLFNLDLDNQFDVIVCVVYAILVLTNFCLAAFPIYKVLEN